MGWVAQMNGMKWLGWAALLAAAAAPARAQERPAVAATAGVVDPAFAGHYYLSGVHEVGSELLLRADGSFAWFMSYGAADQQVNGTWTREGQAVVLRAAMPDRTRPLYALLGTEPWSERPERALRDQHYQAEVAAVQDRCPILGGVMAAPALSPALIGEEAESPASLKARADEALAQLQTARAAAERLAGEAIGPNGPVPGKIEAAQQALGEWELARQHARNASRAADLPDPELLPPVLPPACTMPQEPDIAAARDERGWIGGLAVRVLDPESDMGARRVAVTLSFADGHEERLETADRGLAIHAGAVSAPLVSVRVSAPFAPERDQTIAVPPVSAGVVAIGIDAKQLTPPPFERLDLSIDGTALLPEAFGRGRYERGN